MTEFIKWDILIGECPVPGDTVVEVIDAAGHKRMGKASSWYWFYQGWAQDVAEYRVVPVEERFIAREWYLIQRLMERTVPRPDGKGVDTLVSHDYMGSAEFEWGAIPSSWSKLRELAAAGKLVRYETPFHSIKNTPFYVIASSDDDRDIVFKGIAELGANGVHTKEPTYMDAWLKVLRVNDSTKYKREVSAWLRVSDNSRRHNPLLWCVDQKLATQLWMNLTEGKSVQAPPGVVTEPVKSIDPSELTMFDNITFEHHAKTWTGQIRGIYSDHVQVRRPDGGKQCVKYESIRSYSK